jgi:hypothetical protein
MPTKEQIAAALPKHIAKFEKELTASVAQYHESFGVESPLFELFAANPGRNVSSITMEVKEGHLNFRVVWAKEGFDNLTYTLDTETKRFAANRFNHIIFKTDNVHHKASVRFRKLVVDTQS